MIGEDYPEPVVDHQAERRRAMGRYAAVLGADRRGTGVYQDRLTVLLI